MSGDTEPHTRWLASNALAQIAELFSGELAPGEASGPEETAALSVEAMGRRFELLHLSERPGHLLVRCSRLAVDGAHDADSFADALHTNLVLARRHDAMLACAEGSNGLVCCSHLPLSARVDPSDVIRRFELMASPFERASEPGGHPNVSEGEGGALPRRLFMGLLGELRSHFPATWGSAHSQAGPAGPEHSVWQDGTLRDVRFRIGHELDAAVAGLVRIEVCCTPVDTASGPLLRRLLELNWNGAGAQPTAFALDKQRGEIVYLQHLALQSTPWTRAAQELRAIAGLARDMVADPMGAGSPPFG
jgi:hypothetical protein